MAMAEARKKEIDGITFQVAPFMAIDALKLKAYLVRVFGPALGELLSGLQGGGKDVMDVDISKLNIGMALEKLFTQLDEDSFVRLLQRLFANTIATWTADGKSHSVAFNTDFATSLDLVFGGKLFSIYPAAAFILEANFPDFFTKVVRGIGTKISLTNILPQGEPPPPKEQPRLEMSGT
jgi:hypothetical protein